MWATHQRLVMIKKEEVRNFNVKTNQAWLNERHKIKKHTAMHIENIS
jgi:hypothetical protein